MVSSDAVWTVTDLSRRLSSVQNGSNETYFDRWYPQPLHRVSVPETHPSRQQDGLIGRQLLDDFIDVGLCKVGGRHGVRLLVIWGATPMQVGARSKRGREASPHSCRI